MYSHEIDALLKSKNYNISSNDYKKIIASPQLVNIKYTPFDDMFEIVDDEFRRWRFTVYRSDE